jgi:isopenicillin N synthase-like dioxygenase
MPKCLQGHEAELLDFEARCRKTCHRILRLLALGLEVCSNSFTLRGLFRLLD